MNEEVLDKITQFVVIALVFGVAGFILTLVAISLVGPQLVTVFQFIQGVTPREFDPKQTANFLYFFLSLFP
jgi:hypothetical protein